MVPSYSLFDTPCIFSRELRHLKTTLNSWIPQSSGPNLSHRHSVNPNASSYEIVYLLDYVRVANQSQMSLINDFLNDAAAHLPATIKEMSIRDTWKSSHPEGTPNSIDEYLREVTARTLYYAFYHSSDDFRQEYAEAHDSDRRAPLVTPSVRRRWARGATVTATQHQEATARLNVYKEWLMRTVFHHDSPGESQKLVLLILTISNVGPNYRDVPSESPSREGQYVLGQLFLPPILGAPDIAVPIGDVPYASRIRGQNEYLPVVVDLVAAPGKDWELLDAVEKIMAGSGRPSVVRTGKRMFAPSEP